jgi:hypothetical protein
VAVTVLSPVLLLHGEADPANSPAECGDLSAALGTTAPVRRISYRGAAYAWDLPQSSGGEYSRQPGPNSQGTIPARSWPELAELTATRAAAFLANTLSAAPADAGPRRPEINPANAYGDRRSRTHGGAGSRALAPRSHRRSAGRLVLGCRQMLDLVRIPARPERQAYGHAGDPERAREIASSPAAAPSHLAPGPARNARGARTVRRWRQPGRGASRRPPVATGAPSLHSRGITPGWRPRIRRNGSGYRPWSTAQPGRPW